MNQINKPDKIGPHSPFSIAFIRCNESEQTIGVADGVSEWANFGVHPKIFPGKILHPNDKVHTATILDVLHIENRALHSIRMLTTIIL